MRPLPNGLSNADAISAYEIANANSTANAFLGIHRPAWLPVDQAPSQTARSARSALPFTLSARSNPNSHQAQEQNNNSSTRTGSVGAGLQGERVPSPPSMLRSPIPTNVLSPTASLGSRNPALISHATPRNFAPLPSEGTRQPHIPHKSTSKVPRHAVRPPQHEGHDLSHTNPPVQNRVLFAAEPNDAATRPAALHPARHGVSQYLGTAESSRSTNTGPSVPQVGSKRKVPGSNALGPTPKRFHSSSRLPSNESCPEANSLVRSVRRQVGSWPSLQDPSNQALRLRYELLEEAAVREDWSFLTLHCLYFQWQNNPNALLRELQTSHPETAISRIQASFRMLNVLFPSVPGMDSRHTQWFAVFPTESITHPPDYIPASTLNEVISFLCLFASQWPTCLARVSQRGYPLLVHEFHEIHCMSSQMQLNLDIHLLGNLNAIDGVQDMAQELFEDRAFENFVRDGRISGTTLTPERNKRAVRLKMIVEKHRHWAGSLIYTPGGQEVQASTVDHRELQPPGQQALVVSRNQINPPSWQLPSPPQQIHVTQPRQHQLPGPLAAEEEDQVHAQQLLYRVRPEANPTHSSMNPQQYQSNSQTAQDYQPHEVSSTSWLLPSTQLHQRTSQSQQHYQLVQGTFDSGPTRVAGTLSPEFLVAPQQYTPGQRSHTVSAIPVVCQTGGANIQGQSAQLRLPADNCGTSVAVSHGTNPPSTLQNQHTNAGLSSEVLSREVPHTEYPSDTRSLSSLAPGMHFIHHRSPIREPQQPTNVRFYQYVSGYAAIKTLKPQVGLERVEFNIEDHVMNALVTTQFQHGLERCQFREDSRRIRLRLCRYPDNVEDFENIGAPAAATYWPEDFYVSLGKYPLQLPRKQHFRTDLPVELTELVRRGLNTIVMSLPKSSKPCEGSQKYLIMIEIVAVSSAGSLKNQIFSCQHFSYEQTKSILQSRVACSRKDDDDVVVQDKHLSVSVTDPFSSTLCTMPVRSIHCKHVECFDLHNWLESRPTKPSKRAGEPSRVDEWKCPICGGDARPLQLRIDDFFIGVRERLIADGLVHTKMIQVDDQGNWSAVVEHDLSEDDEDFVAPARNAYLRTGRPGRKTRPSVIVREDGT